MQPFKTILETGRKYLKKGLYLVPTAAVITSLLLGSIGCSEKLPPPPPTVTYESMGKIVLDPKFADRFMLVDGQTLIDTYGIDYQTLSGVPYQYGKSPSNNIEIYGKGLVGDLDNDGNKEVLLLTNLYNTTICADTFTICRVKDGKLTKINTVPSGRSLCFPEKLEFRDTNSDGNMEVISSDLDQWIELYVYENLMNPRKVLDYLASGGGPYSPTYALHIKDLDCDGSDEIWIDWTGKRTYLAILYSRDGNRYGNYKSYSESEAPNWALSVLNDLNNSPSRKNMSETEKVGVLENIHMTLGDQLMWKIVSRVPVYDEESGWMPYEPYIQKKAEEYERTCNSEWLENTSFGKKENLYKLLLGYGDADQWANEVFGKKYNK